MSHRSLRAVLSIFSAILFFLFAVSVPGAFAVRRCYWNSLAPLARLAHSHGIVNVQVCDTYTVQPGESAISIADKLQIDYDELLSALSSCIGFVEGSVLQIGQTICLPPYTPACRFVSSSGECTRYTVQYGDTLSIVASSFKLDMDELAKVNKLNVTTPVRPNARLVLPPVGKGCDVSSSASSTAIPSPVITPSPPTKDTSNSKCKMWLSSGGETIASIAEANKVDVGELKRANGDTYPKSTDVTKPGAFVYLPPFDKNCKPEDVVVVNRPDSGDSASVGGQVVPVGGSGSGEEGTSPTQAPSSGAEAYASSPAASSPAASPASAESSNSTSAESSTDTIPVNRLVVDVFLADMSREEFITREYNFRENMAYAANISIIDVDVRFSITVSSLSSPARRLSRLSSRKLLERDGGEGDGGNATASTTNNAVSSGSYLKVNTAMFGPTAAVYDAFTASIDTGAFPEMMDSDAFNVVYVTAMYPDSVTLYDAATDPNNVTDATATSEPFYAPLSMWAFIGICAGGGVALILTLAGLCWCRSRRKRNAAEKRSVEIKAARVKEASKHRKIVESNGIGNIGGSKGGVNMSKGDTREIRIDAYANQGAARPPGMTNVGARDASITPLGDRERSFTSYLMDGTTSETPRFSTATPRRDGNSMGQELTRRASSMTETTSRGGIHNRDAVITPRPHAGNRTTVTTSTTPRVERVERVDRVTPRGTSFTATTTIAAARRESSPNRLGVTPRGGSPRRSSYAEF